jgi:pilus assembly protein Flp/PilA
LADTSGAELIGTPGWRVIWRREVMNYFAQLFLNLRDDASGQDLIEYALVAALIGLGATAAMNNLASSIRTTLDGIGSKLTTAV